MSVDSLRLRVREATSPDASEITELSGQVVTVSRDRVGSILVLDRDRSGEFMAGAFVVSVAAGLAGFLRLPGGARERSGRRRAIVGYALLAAQLGAAGCATSRAAGPAERDIVSVAFAEPRTMTAPSGEEIHLLSLVGRIERDSMHVRFVRVADATEVDGRSTAPLVGARIRIGEYGPEAVSVLRRDRSRRTLAVVAGIPTLAFLVGIVLGRAQ